MKSYVVQMQSCYTLYLIKYVKEAKKKSLLWF